jgi:K+-sensing histidine kinase KdpD
MSARILVGRKSGYVTAVAGIATAMAVMKLPGSHINSTTVALALLMVVLFIATRWGAGPAVVASLLGMLCFNFFFLPPLGTFTITGPDNWVALAAFLLTAVTAGQLSARAKQRAEEAEAGRREIERLYKELQDAFERASLAEAIKRSEKLKSSLLDAVTHDLRTPLTSIKASATALLDELRTSPRQGAAPDAEGQREMLEVINEEADRLNRFVESLLELARIEAGEMRLRCRWGTIDEIVMTARQRAEPLTRGHVVEVSLEEGLPLMRVDAPAIAEVTYTLIDNAAKYSRAGSRIRVTASRAGGKTVRLAVEDEGRGIRAELRERVFDKFYRAPQDDESAVTQPGLGMGLAIARGIVEAHGGRIWVEDGGGNRGTLVAFTLPVSDDAVFVEQSQGRDLNRVD